MVFFGKQHVVIVVFDINTPRGGRTVCSRVCGATRKCKGVCMFGVLA